MHKYQEPLPPPKMAALRSRLLVVEPLLTNKNKPPSHTCYHIKFGSFATKGKGVCIREPQTLGALALGLRPIAAEAWLTPSNTLFLTCVILPNLVVLGQTVRVLLSRTDVKKNLPPPASLL